MMACVGKGSSNKKVNIDVYTQGIAERTMYTYQSDRICINVNTYHWNGNEPHVQNTHPPLYYEPTNLRDIRLIGDSGECVKDIHDGGRGNHFRVDQIS